MKHAEVVMSTLAVMSDYDFRLTVRQIYYRLLSHPFMLFPNTKSAYTTFDKILTRARENGDIDWQRIADTTRHIRKRDTWKSINDYLDDVIKKIQQNLYIKDLWQDQDEYIEVVVEKEALASLFETVTNGYITLLYPSRGFSSYTKIMEACLRYEEIPEDKPITILHFSDHDPSGIDMTRDIKTRFERYSDRRINIERVGLTIEQVREFNLEPNPIKRADSRAVKYKNMYGDTCWELDALPPNELKRIIKTAIEEHIDFESWNNGVQIYEKENDWLNAVLKLGADAATKVFANALTQK